MFRQRKLISFIVLFLFIFHNIGLLGAKNISSDKVYGALVKPTKVTVKYIGSNTIQYSNSISLIARVVQTGGKDKHSLSLAKVNFNISSMTDDNQMISVGSYTAQCDKKGYASTKASLGVGVYSISVSVADEGYFTAATDTAIVTVYNHNSGYATGSGWIKVNSSKSGNVAKANFSFDARYKGNSATGKFDFQYKDKKIDFKSKQIDWLKINSTRAEFQGIGDIKGMTGKYTFRISCTDNKESKKTDKVTIRIWKGTDTNAEPIYKALDVDLGGGNILVKSDISTVIPTSTTTPQIKPTNIPTSTTYIPIPGYTPISTNDNSGKPIYKHNKGFVTGGGWIKVTSSEQGNIGKSNFSFNVRYKGNSATGKFDFQYKDKKIDLKSKQIDWLKINSTNAEFQGIGDIKGMAGKYTFKISCTDNKEIKEDDKVTIRIWKGTNTNEEPIYKALNVSLGSGNISVKSDKNASNLNTQIGTNVQYVDSISGVKLNFENVTNSGYTTVTTLEQLPSDVYFNITSAVNYYDISTTASFTGMVTVEIPYTTENLNGEENDLRLFQFKDGQPIDITNNEANNPDTENKRIRGTVTDHFCVFAVGIPADTEAPTAPLNLRSTNKTDTTVTLQWDASTDNVGIAGYDIYNGETLTGSTTGETNFTVSGLEIATPFIFTVKAKDEAGNTSQSSDPITVTTIDSIPPTIPSNFSLINKTDSTVNILWDASTDNVGVIGYEIYRDGTKIGTSTEASYTDTDLISGITYEYALKAMDKEGNLSELSKVLSVTTDDILAPSAPSDLEVTENITGTSIELAWNPSTDNVGVTEYEVYIDGNIIGTTENTTFNVERLQMVTTYLFLVKAKDAAGNVSQSSNEISATTPDTEAPIAPTGIFQTQITNSSISIEWTPSVDNVGVIEYDVYNRNTLIGSTDTNKFTISDLSPGELCVFTIRAKDAAENVSELSSAFNVKTNFNGGIVTKDTVLSSVYSPYIIEENLTVTEGVYLQIMPGTVFLLNPGVNITVDGRMDVAGTNENPVIFTSVKDPNYGGSGVDSNEDYWGNISITESGEFNGNYTKIRYASRAFNVSGKLSIVDSYITKINGASIFIASGDDVTIKNSSIESVSTGIVVAVNNPRLGKLTIEGNTIKNCGMGIIISNYNSSQGSLIIDNNIITKNQNTGICIYGFTAGTLSIKGNSITNNGYAPVCIYWGQIRVPVVDKIINNTFSGNYINEIPCDSIYMIGNLSFDMMLTNNNSYVLNNFVINSGVNLTIQEGTIIKTLRSVIDVRGKLNAVGTADKPVVFTPIEDPYNGGAGLLEEDKGWIGINIFDSGEFNGEYVRVKCGGRYIGGSINVSGTFRLMNSEVNYSFMNGIKIDSSAIVTIKNNSIYSSTNAGIFVSNIAGSGMLTIEGNTIGNCENGIIVAGCDSAEGNIVVDNNIITSSSSAGIVLSGCIEGNIVVKNTMIVTCPTGINIDSTSGTGIVTIESNTITGCDFGILVSNKDSGMLAIENNNITDNSGNGIQINSFKSDSLSIQGNQIKNNMGYPISVNLTDMMQTAVDGIKNNSFNNNMVDENSVDLLAISGTLSNDFRLATDGYIVNGDLTIAQSKTLTLDPGVIFKSMPKVYIFSYGKINAIGSIVDPIVFTSIKDSSYGGSGIDDIESGAPYPACYWEGILLFVNGELNGENIKVKYARHCITKYNTGKLSIVDSEISMFYSSGIQFSSMGEAIIKNTVIENSGIGLGISASESVGGYKIIIEGNTIKGCRLGLGITNYSSFTGNWSVANNTIYGNEMAISVYAEELYNVSINNNVINNNKIGLHLLADIELAYSYANGSVPTYGFSIEGNKITDNSGYPIHIKMINGFGQGEFESIKNNIFSNNFFDGNPCDAIAFTGNVDRNLILKKGTYFVSDYLYVGYILTLNPGVIIKGDYSTIDINTGVSIPETRWYGITVSGRIDAIGSAEDPVIFTVSGDPLYGGNGKIYSNKNIVGINLLEGGDFYGENIKIRYYGDISDTNQDICNPAISIGLYSQFKLVDSEISNSLYGGINFDTYKGYTLSGNSFNNNKNYAIYNCNPGTVTIDASNNSWGSLDGPSVYDSDTGKWIGNGEKVSHGVIYTPWLGAENKIQAHFGEVGANTATGNYSKSFTDMSVTIPGFEVSLSRTYNSMNKNNGSMGRGWTFGFEGSITDYQYNNDSIKKKIVNLPNGGALTFDYSSGVFIADDSRNSLEKLNDGSYILTTKDQYSYGFDTNGFMSWMMDKNGNKLLIQVDSAGKVQKITDVSGRNFVISYNADGLIGSISDPAGNSITYRYENGLLVEVIDRLRSLSKYSYDEQGFLAEIWDNDSNLIESIVYNHSEGPNKDKIEKITNVYGNTLTYSYNNVKGITTITDTNGRKTIQNHDNSFNITKSIDMEDKTTEVEYYKDEHNINRYGEAKSVTNRNGNKSTYDRDIIGNITKVTNPTLSTKETDYDEKNNLIFEKDEMGKCTYYIYDADKINLIKKVQPLNGTDVYSEAANQSKFAITEYTYYSDSERQTLGYAAKGLLKSVKDPEGKITTYEYDVYGNVKSVTDPMGNKTTYEYDILGRKTKETTPKGYTTYFEYDDNGNLLKKITHGGETTNLIYDAEGRKTEEVSPKLYAEGKTGYKYTYYTSGKIKTSTDPEGNITSYSYDYYGNLETETKPNGAVYIYEYDNMNRLVTLSFSENSTAVPSVLETYAYEILDDGKTSKTTIKYLDFVDTAVTVNTFDYAGRLIEQLNPDDSTITTVYNENGTIKSSTDANENTTYFSYDGLNRLTDKWNPFEEVNGVTKYTYTSTTYDKAGKKVCEKVGKDKVNLNGIASQYITTNYEYYDNSKTSKVMTNDGRKTEYTYDEDGNITRENEYVDSTSKNTVEYEYNYLGKPVVTKVHVNAGEIKDGSLVLITTYTYDINGNLKTQTTPDGVTTTYEYDSMDRKTVVRQPGQDENGNSVEIITETTYNWEGKPLTVKDPNGNITNYTYNQRGLLVYSVDAKGGTSAYEYDNAGRKTVEISPKNYIPDEQTSNMNRVVYQYDEMGRVLTKSYIGKYTTYNPESKTWNDTPVATIINAYTYDNNGNVLKEQDALGYKNGYGTEYTYNCANKPVTVLDPVAKERELSYTTYYTYDALGRKITETNAKGVITSYEYDDAGNVTKVSVKKSESSAEQTIQLGTYDFLGNVLTKTDGNGNTTTFEYNALNKVKKVVYPSDDTIGANTVTYEYDNMGNVVSTKDTLGRVVIYTYDNQGRVLSSTQQKENGLESITISARYDKNGNKRFEIDGRGIVKENKYDALNKLSSTSISGKTTTYEYDANGNQTKQSDWRGNTYTNTYDALDRLIEKKDPNGKSIQKIEYNENNAQIKAYDTLDNMTGYIYDKNNRLISTIDPANHETSQTYDNVGNVETKTDGRNNTTTYEYDEFNRLVSVKNAKNETTNYTYDLNGNILTQKDAKGNITLFKYNVVNKVIEKTCSDSQGNSSNTESYSYNEDGTLKTSVDRNGNITTYTYDIHGRLTNKQIGDISGDISIIYTYDENGNQLTVNDVTGTTEREFDDFNRVITKKVPNIGTSTYNYDIIEGVSEGFTAENSIDSKGNKTVKVYDKAGRLSSVTADGKTTTYEYYDNGSRKSVIYADGSREDYTYDVDGLLSTLTNIKADGSVMDTYKYTYDSAHNQLTKEETINGIYKGITSYTYDVLNRLETVSEPNQRETVYTFDASGNRKTETITEGQNTTVNVYSYDGQNRLTGITTTLNGTNTQTTTYEYDNNGNQTKTLINGEVAVTNVYDKLNQLIKTISEGTTVENKYNGEGYRVEKTVNGTLTRYLYEYDKVVLEVDGNGNQTGRNIYGTNLLMRSTGGQSYYYMYNGHADVTALINVTTGHVDATYYYDAFGNIIESTGDVNNNITYAGYQYDKETGFYYLNARMYDPKIARFLQEDTYLGDTSDTLSLNLYTYCVNNPLIYYDPTGHSPKEHDFYRSLEAKANEKQKYLEDDKNTLEPYIIKNGKIDVKENYFNNTFELSPKKPTSSINKNESNSISQNFIGPLLPEQKREVQRGELNPYALEQNMVYDFQGKNEKDIGGNNLFTTAGSRLFGVFENVNCYAYSLGLYTYADGTVFSKKGNGGSGGIAPGDIAAWYIENKYGEDFSQMSKDDVKLLQNTIFRENRQDVINCIKADAQVLGWEIEEVGKEEPIPEGSYRIMFGFKNKIDDPQLVRDFHFVRENKDGTWSSKSGGGGKVTNDGKEPEDVWGDFNYENSRIYFYVKRK